VCLHRGVELGLRQACSHQIHSLVGAVGDDVATSHEVLSALTVPEHVLQSSDVGRLMWAEERAPVSTIRHLCFSAYQRLVGGDP